MFFKFVFVTPLSVATNNTERNQLLCLFVCLFYCQVSACQGERTHCCKKLRDKKRRFGGGEIRNNTVSVVAKEERGGSTATPAGRQTGEEACLYQVAANNNIFPSVGAENIQCVKLLFSHKGLKSSWRDSFTLVGAEPANQEEDLMGEKSHLRDKTFILGEDLAERTSPTRFVSVAPERRGGRGHMTCLSFFLFFHEKKNQTTIFLFLSSGGDETTLTQSDK